MGSAGGGRTSSDSHRRSCDVNRDECPEPEVCTCCAARAVANFGFKRGTRSIELLVSLWLRSWHQRVTRRFANLGIGTLVPRTRSSHMLCCKGGCELRNRDTSGFALSRRRPLPV